MKPEQKRNNRIRRHKRVRKQVLGTTKVPRVVVFRSNQYLYGQIVDDIKKITIVGMSDKQIEKGSKSEKAMELGKALGKEAKAKKITKVVFDRGGYQYHGRIKSFADGLRESGLQF